MVCSSAVYKYSCLYNERTSPLNVSNSPFHIVELDTSPKEVTLLVPGHVVHAFSRSTAQASRATPGLTFEGPLRECKGSLTSGKHYECLYRVACSLKSRSHGHPRQHRYCEAETRRIGTSEFGYD